MSPNHAMPSLLAPGMTLILIFICLLVLQLPKQPFLAFGYKQQVLVKPGGIEGIQYGCASPEHAGKFTSHKSKWPTKPVATIVIAAQHMDLIIFKQKLQFCRATESFDRERVIPFHRN